MSKYEVTEADVLALCAAGNIPAPDDIAITPRNICILWAGNRTDDALALFIAGLGLLWDFDNDSETQEWEVKVCNDGLPGFSTAAIISRSV